MVPFKRAMIVFNRLSMVTIALYLYLTIQPQFAVECLRVQRSNHQGWITLGQNLKRKRSTDVSQILPLSWRERSHVESFCRLSTAHERNRQTNHGTVTLTAIGELAFKLSQVVK